MLGHTVQLLGHRIKRRPELPAKLGGREVRNVRTERCNSPVGQNPLVAEILPRSFRVVPGEEAGATAFLLRFVHQGVEVGCELRELVHAIKLLYGALLLLCLLSGEGKATEERDDQQERQFATQS